MNKYRSVYSILSDFDGEYDHKNGHHIIGTVKDTPIRISYYDDESPDLSHMNDEKAQDYTCLVIAVDILPTDESVWCKACKDEDFGYSHHNPCTCTATAGDVCGGVEHYLKGYGATESDFVTSIIEDMLAELVKEK